MKNLSNKIQSEVEYTFPILVPVKTQINLAMVVLFSDYQAREKQRARPG